MSTAGSGHVSQSLTMNLRFWLTNRVLIGLALFFILVGFWEFRWKPQYRPHYETGVSYYQAGKYMEALNAFQQAYEIAPNSLDVIMMMGWANLKVKRFEDARFYFDRAIKIDPRTDEAQIGAAFVALETGRGRFDPKVLKHLIGKRGGEPSVRILAANALLDDGKNLEAAEIYRELAHDRDYGEASRLALDQIFGLKGFPDDKLPAALPAVSRPAQTQIRYRAADKAMWAQSAGAWKKMYISGVNVGPGAPGYYPSSPPNDAAMYADWLRSAEKMNANVVRVYTLLPPAFYRAYRHYLGSGGKVALYQQIWVSDPPNKDLYDPQFVEATKTEIRYVVDAIHGHADVPRKRARGSGVYDQDIADHVAALLLGRELEPSTVMQTNIVNAGRSGYQGRFISIERATATETWFAEMLDYLIVYELDTYNWEHPVAIVNWPPLDPLNHPTEAGNTQEVAFRMRRGEQLALPKGVDDDNDAVSIDEAKYKPSPSFFAGMFASYHVYPYYPDFLILDPGYLKARDSQGLNPMYGYLEELRAHIPLPLVISEYGIPDSIGISHFHPYGWHHGGHTEQQQAEILTRLGKGIQEAGCAGGIVFSLIDEWYKHNWLTVDFEDPLERAALWDNQIDPEKSYGVIGFHPAKWKLFTGAPDAWEKEQTLYSNVKLDPANDGFDGARSVRSVQAAVDEAFLYLRITVDCLGCGRERRRDNLPHFEQVAYAVAINTLPGIAGIEQLPFGPKLPSGADFLLYLAEPADSRLLIADSYNPYQIKPKPGVANETELSYRRGFTVSKERSGSFVEMVVETNRKRYGRDGTAFPGQRYSRSVLRYGNGNPGAPDYDSLAEWYADVKRNQILVRIPWGKLYMTDPSSRSAFYRIDGNLNVGELQSGGVEISVFALKHGPEPAGAWRGITVQAAAPSIAGGVVAAPGRITWKTWDSVTPEPYFKRSYYALQRLFAEEQRAAR